MIYGTHRDKKKYLGRGGSGGEYKDFSAVWTGEKKSLKKKTSFIQKNFSFFFSHSNFWWDLDLREKLGVIELVSSARERERKEEKLQRCLLTKSFT